MQAIVTIEVNVHVALEDDCVIPEITKNEVGYYVMVKVLTYAGTSGKDSYTDEKIHLVSIFLNVENYGVDDYPMQEV